ncbi:hypothetical protein PSTT_02432 [Puccinia striiformis]|uniref:Uncharacterized protein n=1 Tax=Puccinia striiformis TaxID=27350 RepID=A0A2S4W047_9BASI|nr:hypothetical protein PSTT_02432 [Puccinia striiformis]
MNGQEQLGANQHLYASACFAGKEAIGILKVKNQRIEVAASASMTGMAAFMNSSHTILHMVEEATPVLTRTQSDQSTLDERQGNCCPILSLLLQGWEYLKCTNSQMADQKYHNNLCGSSTVVHLKLFRDCCQEAAIAVTKHCPSHADKGHTKGPPFDLCTCCIWKM